MIESHLKRNLFSYKFKIRKPFEYLVKFFILILVIAVFAFNDQKNYLYIVKVSYIIVMGALMLFCNLSIRWHIVWSALFISFSLASMLWAGIGEEALYYFFWILQAYLIFMVTANNLYNEEMIEYLFKCFIIGSIILVIRLLLVTPTNKWGTGRIGYSIGYNPNVIGIQMIIAIMSVFYFFNKSKRKLLLPLIILFLTVLLFSGSRKAILALMFGIFVYLLYINIDKAKKFIFYSLFATLILLGVYYLIFNLEMFYNVIGYRLEILFGVFTGESDNIRIYMIKEGIDLFTTKPIIGNGINAFARLSSFGTYSHNNYIEMLANFGIIGFIVYYSMYAYILFNLIFGRFDLKKVGMFLSIISIILFLEIGLVSYREIYILLPLASAYSYIIINKKMNVS